MRKKITRLVCAGMASCCVLMAAGQEKAAEVKIIDREAFSENRSELRADSVVWYDDIGNRGGGMGSMLAMIEYYRPEMTYIEDKNGRFWLQSMAPGSYYRWHGDYDVKYNSNGLVESMTDGESLLQLQYNANGYLISVDEYYLFQAEDESAWIHYNHMIYTYDTYGNWVGFQEYYVGGDIPELMRSTVIHVDNKGRIVRHQVRDGDGGKLNYYCIWYYSDTTYTPDIALETNTSVGSNNQGSFDLNVNVPTDSISSGSVTVTFPEGFTLDEENTSLTLDFAADFTLTITKQENNSWLLEIKPKALRNASLRADEVQKAIQIAYLVDEEVKRGSYDISVNSILFETPYGNIIPEPAITVPADLNRWGVANERIEDANVAVYVTGNTLYIQTPQSETITVYAINGSKLYEATVSSGTVTVDASAFPQGVLIVKGSSGWVKKIVKDSYNYK